MDYLNDMALFVEVARAGSYRAAAAASGVPASTLSRRITLLEKSLGLRLLHRTTRRIELTEAGQLYFERSQRLVEEARVAHEELGELVLRPQGTLRVSMPVDFATIWIAPLLPRFARLYPELEFDFDLTPRNVDPIAERFDVLIRMGPPQSELLISRPIGTITPRLYAARGYLEAVGHPEHPADLERMQCLWMATNQHWSLHAGNQSFAFRPGARFRVNNIAFMRALAVQEMGVVLLPERAVARELAAGELQPVLPEWSGSPVVMHAITDTRLLPAKTRRFIEFLQAELA